MGCTSERRSETRGKHRVWLLKINRAVSIGLFGVPTNLLAFLFPLLTTSRFVKPSADSLRLTFPVRRLFSLGDLRTVMFN